MKEAIAVRFDRDLTVGRNKPVLLGCEVEERTIEVVAKFAHRCERGRTALIAEGIAAMLAADLDLPIPEPFVVALDPDLKDLLEESVTGWPRNETTRAFGLARLPAGFATIPVDRSVPAALVPVAAEILLFDVIIDNCDRLPRNPNCMFDGKSLAIFDHELAFPSGVLGWRPPWETGALDTFAQGQGKHLFCDALRGRRIDLNRFIGAMEAVSDTRLEQYAEALPPEWLTQGNDHRRMLEHVKTMRNRISDIATQLQAVLS